MVLAAFACVQKDNVNLEWKKEGQGIWKISVGKQEKVTLLSELDITPQWKAIEEIGDAPLAIDPKDVKTEVVDGKTYIRFPLDKDEKIFGLGLNFKTVEQRGRVMRLHVDHSAYTPGSVWCSGPSGCGQIWNNGRAISSFNRQSDS